MALGLRRTAAVLLALAACGASDGDDPCLAVVREYQREMPSALVCDPAVDACTTGRPLIVSQAEPDGTFTLEGLCAPLSDDRQCLGAVNPARTARIDQLLATFERMGCAKRTCFCPSRETLPPRCAASGEWAGTCVGIWR